MAITLNFEGEIDSVEPIRNNSFTFTITAEADEEEVIESVVTTMPNGKPITINIEDGATSSTVSGYYTEQFQDVCTFISAGSTDKIETPTTVIGIENVPENKCIIEFIQDTSQHVIANYQVTVTHDMGVDVFNLTHKNLNDWVTPGQQLAAHVKNYAEKFA